MRNLSNEISITTPSLILGSILLVIGAEFALPCYAEDSGTELSASRLTSGHADNLIAADMTRQIDEHMQVYWRDNQIKPAKVSTDAEFLRRVSLDLTGVIPSVAKARSFLGSRDPDKRSKVIDRLLQSPRHPTHMANTWRKLLLPDGTANSRGAIEIGMQTWLRDRFAENLRYDRLVGDFLTATGSTETGPVLFYQALELKPEKLAATTARCFLGMQLECAQCHDHPFVDTTQEEFWGFAAFFARVTAESDRQGMTMTFSLEDQNEGDVQLPESDTIIAPSFPGSNDTPGGRGTRRQQLSLWMASPNNRYLAPATVNRIWQLLFGRGLVHPVDDMGPHNLGEHPRLLADLSDSFRASGYDLRELFRAIANSQPYQFSSDWPTDRPRPAASAFALARVRPLTADQLYDSLQQCLLISRDGSQSSNPLVDPQRSAFVQAMQTRDADPTAYEASLQQTLTMMNGSLIGTFTRVAVDLDTESKATEPLQLATESPSAESPTDAIGDQENGISEIENSAQGLLAALQAPFLGHEEKLDWLFLATLTRTPTDGERNILMAEWPHAETGGDNFEILSDLLWSIVNSAEFRFNH